MSRNKLPENILVDNAEYRELLAAYRRGEIVKADLKQFLASFGVYEQRLKDKYMLRIRLPGGVLTPLQLRVLAGGAAAFTNTPLHLTTRSAIQIHDLNLQDTAFLLTLLQEHGLCSRGGGGNTLRNIIGNSDSGYSPDDVFDIFPFLQALTDRMLAETDSWTLPRKFKIAFTSSPVRQGLVKVNDLGFCAKINEQGEYGFTVYIAGGMGRQPRTGILLFDFLHHEEVYNVVKAAKNLFNRYGNRQNRNKARLRFLLEELGEEKFLSLFRGEYEQVQNQAHPPLAVDLQKGRQAVSLYLGVFAGELELEYAMHLGQIMENYNRSLIRVTTCQSILLVNLPAERKAELAGTLSAAGLEDHLPPWLHEAVSCPGATLCPSGLRHSRNLLKAIKVAWGIDGNTHELLNDLRLKISGCIHTCAQHLLADIGFAGITSRFQGKSIPCYRIFLGGLHNAEPARLAEAVGILAARLIPRFLLEFMDFIKQFRRNGESFADFLERCGRRQVEKMLVRYTRYTESASSTELSLDWHIEGLEQTGVTQGAPFVFRAPASSEIIAGVGKVGD